MTSAGLSWFRSRQRKLARGVLALFCLTWLQLAVMPCLMATELAPGLPSTSAPALAADATPGALPVSTGAGEHCTYCPPASNEPGQHGANHAVCAYPHDPQVDSRSSLALGMALPAAAPVFVLMLAAPIETSVALAAPPLAPHATSLAVRYCRFLK